MLGGFLVVTIALVSLLVAMAIGKEERASDFVITFILLSIVAYCFIT